MVHLLVDEEGPVGILGPVSGAFADVGLFAEFGTGVAIVNDKVRHCGSFVCCDDGSR